MQLITYRQLYRSDKTNGEWRCTGEEQFQAPHSVVLEVIDKWNALGKMRGKNNLSWKYEIIRRERAPSRCEARMILARHEA